MFIIIAYHKIKIKYKGQELIFMKKFFYSIMVVFSAIFLVNMGVGEQEAIEIIPDMKP